MAKRTRKNEVRQQWFVAMTVRPQWNTELFDVETGVNLDGADLFDTISMLAAFQNEIVKHVHATIAQASSTDEHDALLEHFKENAMRLDPTCQ